MTVKSLLVALLALPFPAALAVEFRAATFNIGAHFNAEGNIDYSLNAPGTPDYESVRAILARIDADVVALEEIAGADVAGNPDNLDALAATLGYSYLYTAPVTQALPLAGPIDTSLRVTFLSRFPLIATASIRSPEGAREITRLFPVVTVDVPGTAADPVLVAAHLKSGTATTDRFRRAVELKRMAGYLASRNFPADANFIVMGDFNLSSMPTTFGSPPPGLPASFDLGDDLAALPSITYSIDPLDYFRNPALARPDLRQLDNSTATLQTGSAIDVVLVSQALQGRPIATEIYNSALDTANGQGLAKAGAPLAAATSATASDHYAVFGDFELDEDFPRIALTVTPAALIEGASASLEITLPQTRPGATIVSFTANGPGADFPAQITIPAGALTGSATLVTSRDFLNFGGKSITLSATAASFSPGTALVEIAEADAPYALAGPGAVVTENFDGFAGNHDPSPWLTSGGSWMGKDAGSSALAGFRSYGSGNDGSLGFLAGTAGTAIADFTNASGQFLTALRIDFSAEQWRTVAGGNPDSLAVSLIQNGGETPLPALTFAAATNLPTGPVAGGAPVAKSATVTDLAVPPGGSFGLKFAFQPGPPSGAVPAGVFLNEFHYDNAGTDTGEFVEIVTSPGFVGSLATVNLVLYNGSNGQTYGVVHPLSSFTAGAVTADGYRIYSKQIDGIQNGDPDGFALTVNGSVVEFVSYGGSFTATNGPAYGVISADVGQKQHAPAAGFGSIGRTGGGGLPADFAWAEFAGLAHTPGDPNPGQTFAVPSPSQGIAFDNLAVTFLPPPDRDGDGYDDAAELVFGTDPANAASRFRVEIAATQTAIGLDFPTLPGRTYTVQTSPDLVTWTTAAAYPGTGTAIHADFPNETRVFYRIGASLD